MFEHDTKEAGWVYYHDVHGPYWQTWHDVMLRADTKLGRLPFYVVSIKIPSDTVTTLGAYGLSA